MENGESQGGQKTRLVGGRGGGGGHGSSVFRLSNLYS